MFLAVLVTFTFHHEIRDRLILRGLIVPANEHRLTNPTARAHQELGQPNENQEDRQGYPPFFFIAAHRDNPGLPVVRLPANYQNDLNWHLWTLGFPTALAAREA